MALNCGRASSSTLCQGTTSLLSVELSQSPACIATGYLIQIRIVPAKLLKFVEKTVLSLCADYLSHLTSDNRRVSTNRKPKDGSV